MKRGIIFLSLFLAGVLVLSGCQPVDPISVANDADDTTYNGNGNGGSDDASDADDTTYNGNGNGGSNGGSDDRTQEEIAEETGCLTSLAIDKIFELVEQEATDEEVMQAMCELDCEELNPEYYVC